MTQRDETLRLLSGHLQAAACLVESLLPQADPTPAGPDDEPPVMACPHCGEAREEKHEDTSTDVRRMTCLSCTKSWHPAEALHG